MRKHIFILLGLLLVFISLAVYDLKNSNLNIVYNTVKIDNHEVNKQDKKTITISAIGDCTIGTDTNFSYSSSLNYKYKQTKDYGYFFGGVYDILNNDDLTIANLETTFTDATVKNPKKFNFKGPKDYVNILIKGSVEAVNIANNHTYDYNEKGYRDTVDVLRKAEIEFFGYNYYSIVDIKSVKIGLYGTVTQDYNRGKREIDKAIKYFSDKDVDLIIYSFHWGIEKSLVQNSTQKNLGRYAIDKGVDLVIGHHPHVLQGIEKYKDKYIVYSLANFVFGGNSYPSDIDSMIFQITYTFDNDLVTSDINIIPVSVTSTGTRKNDYRPKVLSGSAKERVMKK